MAFKPSDKRKAPDPHVNPDVTPVMNLMVVLIPLLLNVASFVQLGLLEYSPPLIEEAAPSDELGGGETSQQPGAEAKLNLTLNITFDGFEISMFGATSGEDFITIPKLPNGGYDLDSLHAELVRIREEVIGPPISTKREEDPVSGGEMITYTWKYADAEVLKIAGKGDLPWQVLVDVLDASRTFVDMDGEKKPLFSAPVLGQIQ